jgi:hypothetical protein
MNGRNDLLGNWPAVSARKSKPNQEFKMEARIVRDCDMFGRVITFWKTNSADIPAGSKGAGYYASLGSISSQLVSAGATQKSGKVTAQNALILSLDTDLQNIARTASAIAQDVPGFDDLFAPPPHYNPGEVLATANAYLVQLAAQPGDDATTTAAKAARVKQFTDHALPATFVADLQAQVAAIGSVKDTHEAGREKGVASTTATGQLAREGKKQVKYLDAIAQNLYKGNAEQLRAWASASHVEHDPNHQGATPTPAPAPQTATK